MKKSARVTLVLVSSLAATFMNGCGGSDDGGDWVEAKRCVDNHDVVVEDRLCEQPAEQRGSHSTAHHVYRYYYGGGGYHPGDLAYGGGHIPRQGTNYINSSRVPRGGFGSTGKAFVSRGGSISS
ncbi:MAG: hypothetical protein FJ143_10780 [Deltaproteobacteria bacterium]|nr:hypothetical protein [Deltaproteobacteria bacterium]MBM4298212.1 hypothetical protein [Deltaproteobacteria bacterium]